LLRGSPCVRSWSKHRRTIHAWTLCGIYIGDQPRDYKTTEYAHKTTCRYCKLLLEA
jgi:hypothetical protein